MAKKSIQAASYSLKKGDTVLTDTDTIKAAGIVAGETLNMDYGNISITVSVNGKSIPLTVDPDNLVSTIRTELKTNQGVEGEFKLTLAGAEVVETKTINAAGIKAGSTLVVDYNIISIKVKIGAKTIDIEVDPDNLVSTIKDAVKEKENVAKDAITLKLASETLDDAKTIQASGIKEGTVVTADFKAITVTVNIDGKAVKVGVDPDDEVKTIKDKIKEKENIDGTGYKLVKAGVTIENEAQTIYKAGIKAGTTLVANFNQITIKVKLDGKLFDVDVDPDNKVKTIKDAIKEIKHVTSDRYSLKMGANVLDDQQTIFNSKIKEGTVVTADLNLI